MLFDIHDVEAVRVGIFGHVQGGLVAVGLKFLVGPDTDTGHVEPQNRLDLDHSPLPFFSSLSVA